jgi:hypothetical protein
MWVTSLLIARFPGYGFLLYGGSWLLVLQALGFICWRRRRRFCRVRPAADQPSCLVRGTAAQP